MVHFHKVDVTDTLMEGTVTLPKHAVVLHSVTGYPKKVPREASQAYGKAVRWHLEQLLNK